MATVNEKKRCGTCALLERSEESALSTFGKCPHRSGWVRSFHEACPQHAGEHKAPWITVAKVANVFLAGMSLSAGIWWSIHKGSLLTHVLLALLTIGFGFMLWFAFSKKVDEDAKYVIFDIKDEEPKDDREDFRF